MGLTDRNWHTGGAGGGARGAGAGRDVAAHRPPSTVNRQPSTVNRLPSTLSQSPQKPIRELELIVEGPHSDTLVQTVSTVVRVDRRIREETAHAIHRKPRIPQIEAIGRSR